jgi:hypothetical protein
LLIHIEIQREYEDAFPQRMFDYNMLARQLYNQTVVSLAVLCDDRPAWKPTKFSYGEWGCRMELTFRVAKLLEYVKDIDALEANDNPFAAVVRAHWQTRQTRHEPLNRRQWKLRLMKGLFQRNWKKEDIRQMFRLIDWMMALPQELDKAFQNEIFEYEKQKQMPYVTTFERSGFKRGIEEGEQRGARKGLLKGITALQIAKFGRANRKTLTKIRAMEDLDDLSEFLVFLATANTLEEVDQRLS